MTTVILLITAAYAGAALAFLAFLWINKKHEARRWRFRDR